MSGKLTARQQRFVQLYVADPNATKAYRLAYKVPQKSAETAGPRLLGNVAVANAIAALLKPAAAKAELSAEYIVKRLLEIQDGERDTQSLRALELLGKHMGMFPDRVIATDPAEQSVESLRTRREELRRKLRLA